MPKLNCLRLNILGIELKRCWKAWPLRRSDLVVFCASEVNTISPVLRFRTPTLVDHLYPRPDNRPTERIRPNDFEIGRASARGTGVQR